MEANLIVVSGKTNKGTVTLRVPSTIGRSREVELTVAHPMISRRHCEIFEHDGLLMVRDLGSLNGTMVAGQQVSEAPLCPDDEFTIGPITFRVDYEYDGDLDSLPAARFVDEDAESPPGERRPQVSASEAVRDTPNFVADDAADAPIIGESLPDFSQWDELASKAASDEAEDTGEGRNSPDSRTLRAAAEEEADPAPLAPPSPEDPASKDTAPAPAKEESTLDAPVPSRDDRPGPSEPDAVEKTEASPDFFQAVNSGTDQPAVSTTEDEDLEEFFKGLP